MVYCIQPYEYQGMLVFDDLRVDLVKEPFVQGTPEILYGLCAEVGIPTPHLGFKLHFSASPFEGYQAIANRLKLENGGAWYHLGEHQGWLCPMLFRYFKFAPDKIYFKVEPVHNSEMNYF